jgi:hypothetical protein
VVAPPMPVIILKLPMIALPELVVALVSLHYCGGIAGIK